MNQTESFQEFFERYASLSTGTHPEKLATLYDDSFLAAGPMGGAAFRNDTVFLDWLRQVREFNIRTGMTSLAPVDFESTIISAHYVLVTVRWAATFQKTGDTPIHFRISYLLRSFDGTYKVAAYVAHDDEEEMRQAHGL